MPDSAPSLNAALNRPRRRGCWLLLSGLLGLLLLLAAGVSLALYLLADREQIRAALEQQFGRPVKLAEINPGFLVINLRGLEVSDTAGFAPDPLLTLESASITPAWSYLLSGKIGIAGITLREAVLNLEFDTAGRNNFAGIIKPSEGESRLSLDRVVFDSCAVSLRWPQRRLEHASLTGSVSRLSDPPYEFDIVFTLAGGTLHTTGSVAPGDIRQHAIIEALPLAALDPSLATPPAARLNATLDFALTDTRATLTGSGSVDSLLREFTCDLAMPWPMPAADSRAALPPVTGNFTAAAAVAGLRALPLLAPALNAIDGQGTVSAGCSFDGSGRFALSDIAFQFKDCSLAVPALKERLASLNGPFRVSEQAMTINGASFTVGGLPFSGAGRIGFSPFTLDLAINGERLDLARAAQLTREPVLPAGMTVTGNGGAELVITRTGDATAVAGTVTLAGSQLQLARPALTLTGMTGSISFGGNGLALNRVNAQTCGGTVMLSGTIGTGSRMPFDLALTGNNVGLAPLLAALIGPHAQGGTADCSLRVAGDSANTATYHGGGWLKLDHPQFTEAAFFSKLAPYLGVRDATLLSRYDSGSAVFTLKQGCMQFEQPMRLQNSQVDLAAAGTIDLAGPLALRGQVRVPSRSLAGAIAGISLTQVAGVRNEGERTAIGFKVGGTLQQPSFGIDAGVGNLLGLPDAITNAPSQAVGALLDVVTGFGRRTDTAAAPAAPAETAPANPLSQVRDRFRDLIRR